VSGKIKEAVKFINAPMGHLKVLIVGIEAMSQGAAGNLCLDFIKENGPAMVAIDESICIKNASTIRTKRIIKCCDEAAYRTILNGTPITQGIEDLWSQFRALDWKIIGEKSYYNFKARYCYEGGFQGKKIIGYKNIPELMDRIADNLYQITTEDAIGLPELVYTERYTSPTPEQLKALNELGDPMMLTEHKNEVLDVETILERTTRYQQIVGGSFPYDCDKGHKTMQFDKNPKLDLLISILQDEVLPDEKVIIWTRFKPEAAAIADALFTWAGPESLVSYVGGMSDHQREYALDQFANNPSCRFFVANQSSGAKGIDLHSASIHIYFSNSFSLNDRLQSEMRTHSSKQKSKSILYIDLLMDHDIDKIIVRALKAKKSVADFVETALKERSNI
jgi:SNF2 family DNA or RNA helicase